MSDFSPVCAFMPVRSCRVFVSAERSSCSKHNHDWKPDGQHDCAVQHQPGICAKLQRRYSGNLLYQRSQYQQCIGQLWNCYWQLGQRDLRFFLIQQWHELHAVQQYLLQSHGVEHFQWQLFRDSFAAGFACLRSDLEGEQPGAQRLTGFNHYERPVWSYGERVSAGDGAEQRYHYQPVAIDQLYGHGKLMKHFTQPGRYLALLLLMAVTGVMAAAGQTTSVGTLNVELQNGSGLQLVFQTDASGVTLGNPGTAASTLAFGTVSEYGALGANIARTVGTSTFTISTPFDVNVQESGTSSASYTLAAALASAAPTGITFQVDSVTLSTSSQTISTTSSYGGNVAHTLSAVVSTSASGAGGPTTGTQLTSTIDFTATAN